MDKISIVVPIYKIEKYIKECVDSLLKQTYTNLEIILVDDGSPDNCPQICDEYEKKDNRIKVIHKTNGGLSDARNFVIKACTGKYISFVDGDDYVEKDMYEIAMREMKRENAQIFICGCYYLLNGKTKKRREKKNIKLNMNNVEAIDKMNIFGYYDVSAWGKVYERKLFENIEYPIGKLAEDRYTTYKVLDKAKKIIYDSTPLYIYRQRKNSITHSGNFKVNEDCISACKELMKYLVENHPEIMLNAKTKYVYLNIEEYNNYLVYKQNSREKRTRILEIIKENYNEIIDNQNLTTSRRVQLLLIVKINFIYNILIRIFKYLKEMKVK